MEKTQPLTLMPLPGQSSLWDRDYLAEQDLRIYPWQNSPGQILLRPRAHLTF